jgi:aldehyde dehydrogenase
MATNLPIDENTLRHVVEEVLSGLGRSAPSRMGEAPTGGGNQPVAPAPMAAASVPASARRGPHFGVFADAGEACTAAHEAFLQLKEKGVAARTKVVDIVKEMVTARAVEWGRLEFEETKIGRLEHKIEKLQIVKLVPGVEWLKSSSPSRP